MHSNHFLLFFPTMANLYQQVIQLCMLLASVKNITERNSVFFKFVPNGDGKQYFAITRDRFSTKWQTTRSLTRADLIYARKVLRRKLKNAKRNPPAAFTGLIGDINNVLSHIHTACPMNAISRNGIIIAYRTKRYGDGYWDDDTEFCGSWRVGKLVLTRRITPTMELLSVLKQLLEICNHQYVVPHTIKLCLQNFGLTLSPFDPEQEFKKQHPTHYNECGNFWGDSDYDF